MRRQENRSESQSPLLWVSGYCALPLLAVVVATMILSGCNGIQRTPPVQVWPDMKWQEKFKPQMTTGLFSDGRQTRPIPEGTVARGVLREEGPLTTGIDGKMYVGKSPVAATPALLEEGERRFNIYCAPCHDQTGMGKGTVARRTPTWQPANLTEDRLVQAADGDIFNTITYGRRTMPPYFEQVTVEQRWAIVAWVRVLQRAAHGTVSDVPEAERANLAFKGSAAVPAAAPQQGGKQ